MTRIWQLFLTYLLAGLLFCLICMLLPSILFGLLKVVFLLGILLVLCLLASSG
jgi:hypothetical protein